ncbi:Flp family type IVb pilin [Vibrio breoganii]
MLKTFLTRFIKDERGVTAIEYGVIGVAIAVVIGAVMNAENGIADTVLDVFNGMLQAMNPDAAAIEPDA